MALTLLFTTLATFGVVTAQKDTPFCLQTCLTEAQTTLCAESALSVLTPCLVRVCPKAPATQNLIASLDVSISPKAEYSCQQSYIPSEVSDTEISAVTLPLNGSCTNSPYGFKSFVAQGVSRIRASKGCRVMVFSDADCLGGAAEAYLGAMSSGQCVFKGGRSARLTCLNELEAARAYIQSSCGTDSDDVDYEEDATSTSSSSSSSSSTTTIYPSSAPYHGPGPTSSGIDISTSAPLHWPFSSSTNTADATGSSGSDQITHTITLPTVPSNNTTPTAIPPFSNGLNTTTTVPQNNTQPTTSSPGTGQNATTQSLTLSVRPTAPAAATALASRLGTQSGVAIGFVAMVFAAFL